MTVGLRAQHYRGVRSPVGYRGGAWIYDEAARVPDGVTVFRNTHPALFDADTATRVIAEIERRRTLRGRASPDSAYPFTGLLVCGECGRRLVAMTMRGRRKDRAYVYYACNTRRSCQPGSEPGCSQTRYIRSENVQAHLHALLAHLIATADLGMFGGTQERAYAARRASIETDIADTERRMARMMSALQTVDPDNPAWTVYTREIDGLGAQLRGLQNALADTLRAAAMEDTRVQQAALEDLRVVALEVFWQFPPRTINQLLRRLLGRHRLAVMDGHIRAVVAPANRD